MGHSASSSVATPTSTVEARRRQRQPAAAQHRARYKGGKETSTRPFTAWAAELRGEASTPSRQPAQPAPGSIQRGDGVPRPERLPSGSPSGGESCSAPLVTWPARSKPPWVSHHAARCGRPTTRPAKFGNTSHCQTTPSHYCGKGTTRASSRVRA